MQRLEFGLSATELRHRLLVVHFLDLIVLELLLVQLLSLGVAAAAGKLIDLIELGRAALLHDHTIGPSSVL